MKIAVFGWYGHDNAGDERIKFCFNHFLKGLGGIEEVNFYDLHEYAIKGATKKFDSYDLVIIGGGGLVLSQCNYHDFILGINAPLVTMGISVETKLVGNPRKFVLALLEKSKHFVVRDEASAQKIAPFDPGKKVKVSSDITFLEPYEAVQIIAQGSIGVNLIPKPKSIRYSTLSNMKLLYVLSLFSRLGFPNILRVVEFKEILSSMESKYSLIPLPLYFSSLNEDAPLCLQNDVQFMNRYFAQVSKSFSHTLFDKCNAIFSMRLHGAIFAVQKGIPLISLSYLPKNRNFMRTAGLEEFVVESASPYTILSLVQKCLDDKDTIRDKMLSFTEIASQKIRKDFIEILNSVQ